MPSPLPTAPAPLFRTLAPKGWCAALLDRWRTSRQMRVLALLEPLDRKAVLRDAGLTEGDLAAVSHGGHVRTLLPAALALHGIDASELEADCGDVMHDLLRVCMHCRKSRACARLLACGAGEDHERLCPNRSTLASLKSAP